MSIYVVIAFLSGGVAGAALGAWWVRRTRPASAFAEDNQEADELRTEAKKVVQGRIQKRKDRIAEFARREGRVTNNGVEDMFCIGDNTAGNYLRQLVKEGILIKVGTTGRGVYYEPVDKV